MSLVVFGSSHVKTLEKAVGSVFHNARGVVCQENRIPRDTTFLSVSGMTLAEFNARSDRCRHVRRSLLQCEAKTVVLIAGANDLDCKGNVSLVLDNFTTAVEWLCRHFDCVIVVRLFHRQFPRPFNRHWHFRYPGRSDYNVLSAKVNDGLLSLSKKWSGQVRICRQVSLADEDLIDGVHLNDTGSRKLITVISRALKR